MNKKIFLHLFFALSTTFTTSSMEFPPTTFSWENFSTIKKLLYAAYVSENLQTCPEVDNLIAKKLLALHNKPDIGFILPHAFRHNRSIDHYIKNKVDLEKNILPMYELFINSNTEVFRNNTDFILCRTRDEKTNDINHTIYTKQGDCLFSQLMNPHVTFDWDALSSTLQYKQHILAMPSKINHNLTTAQLTLLDRICVQKRKADESMHVRVGSIIAKTLESFGSNKEFIQKNLLIAEK